MTRAALPAVIFALLCPGSAEAGQDLIATPKYWSVGLAKKPEGKAKRYLQAETKIGHTSRLLVIKQRTINDREWLGLRGPWRPNRAVLWARRSNFYLAPVRFRLQLDLSRRQLSFHKNKGPLLWRSPVVIGAPDRRTPKGLFAIYDHYRSRGAMRPWVFETTAHSKDLDTFMGGDARIALHGRHGWLWAPWRSASSNGCIRTPDWALRKIRKNLQHGMPLLVKR